MVASAALRADPYHCACRHLWRRIIITVKTPIIRQALEQEHASALAASSSDNFQDLDSMGFLVTSGSNGGELRDKTGRRTVLVLASRFPANLVTDLSRLKRCVEARVDSRGSAGRFVVDVMAVSSRIRRMSSLT